MPRVLLVEDELGVREVLAQMLEAEGVEIVALASGRAALTELCAATAEGNSYDAIVLDIVMPDVDGWQVLEALKSNPLWKHLPVVVITGYANGTQALARISRYDAVCVQKNGDFLPTVRAALRRLVGEKEGGLPNSPLNRDLAANGAD